MIKSKDMDQGRNGENFKVGVAVTPDARDDALRLPVGKANEPTGTASQSNTAEVDGKAAATASHSNIAEVDEKRDPKNQQLALLALQKDNDSMELPVQQTSSDKEKHQKRDDTTTPSPRMDNNDNNKDAVAADFGGNGDIDFAMSAMPTPTPTLVAALDRVSPNSAIAGAYSVARGGNRERLVTIDPAVLIPTAANGAGTGSAMPPQMLLMENATNPSSNSNNNNDEQLIEATLVTPPSPMDHQDKPVLAEARPVGLIQQQRLWIFGLLVIVIVAVAITTGFILTRRNESGADDGSASSSSGNTDGGDDDDGSGSMIEQSTLERIREKGFLRCGVSPVIFGSEQNVLEGIENQVEKLLCRAIGTAAMGRDTYKIEMVPHEYQDRVPGITSGDVDVMFNYYSHTMDRDILPVPLDNTNDTVGMSFSKPYWYMTSAFGGWSKHVTCAEQGLQMNLTECNATNVCTVEGLRYWSLLENVIPEGQRTLLPTVDDVFNGFLSGLCNVMIAPVSQLQVMPPILSNYEVPGVDDYTVGGVFSFEPAAMVTRDDDTEWTTFVDLVLQTLLIAEQYVITQETIAHNIPPQQQQQTIAHQSLQNKSSVSIPATTLFGNQSFDMFAEAITISGNYGQIKERYQSQGLEQDPMNFLNNGSTGIMHALPLGFTEIEGPGPEIGGALSRILERGVFRCGVERLDRPGFVESTVDKDTGDTTWSGMDVDYCKAISIAIFGSTDSLEIGEMINHDEGFKMLARNEVDMLAGVMSTLERIAEDPDTGLAYFFSRPYFYNETAPLYDANGMATLLGTDGDSNSYRSLATRNDDIQWAKFVYWLVEAIFFAGDNNISEINAEKMPTVNLFGSGFSNMFQEVVLNIGNYGTMYDHNIEPHVPRSGLNLPYDVKNPGPLLFPLPHLLF